MTYRYLPKLLLATTALVLSACSPFQALQSSRDSPSQGRWVTLSGAHEVKISDGVFIDMPEGPYRPLFSDAQGIFYGASNSLVVRSWPGLSMPTEGGLHVRYNNPDLGYPWYGKHIGAPVIRLEVPVPVVLHRPDR